MTKETLLISGANGLVAKQFAQLYGKNYNIRFLTRTKRNENEYAWDIEKGKIDPEALVGVDHIIHLAGANIAEKRWTNQRKQILRSSRIDAIQLLCRELLEAKITLKSFVSASAIGYYGSQTTDNIYHETDAPAGDFLATLCVDWEQAADQIKELGIAKKVVKLRLGVVLSHDAKLIQTLQTQAKWGLASAIGSGKQYIPWIHIDDLCHMLNHVVKTTDTHGVYNAVAPEHTTNKELTQKIAKALSRPMFMPNVPAFVLRLVLGESAIIALEGSRVSSKKISDTGFPFRYPTVVSALEEVLWV